VQAHQGPDLRFSLGVVVWSSKEVRHSARKRNSRWAESAQRKQTRRHIGSREKQVERLLADLACISRHMVWDLLFEVTTVRTFSDGEMGMLSRTIFVALLLTLGVGLSGSGGQRKSEILAIQEPGKVKDLMRAKLSHSQKVLEGIATSDFDLIARHADDLIQVSKSLEWHVLKTPRYELHSNEFRGSAETLVQQAKDKNLDGATLTYVDMTLNCVKCHKYVRSTRADDK
jgi:hypothetical protein